MADLWQLVILAFLGVFGGVLSGLVGVGGGIIFVPALIYAAGWNIEDAAAASFVIIIFSSLSGVLRNDSSESPVSWRAAALLSATVAPASLIGVFINRAAPDATVKMVFAVLLLCLAYPMVKGGSSGAESRSARIHPALVLVAGVGIGALSGLVGVGGGVMMVPLMILGLGVRPKSAIATSLVIILFTGVVGAVGYIATGFQQFAALPPLIIGSIVGARFGVRLRELTPERPLQLAFAVFMVITAIQLLLDATNVF
jgi:uncharacterized protein